MTNDVITDIKVIRAKTGGVFTLSECTDAYEISGRNVDKAVALLNEKKAADTSISARPSGKEREIKTNNVFISITLLIFLGCLVASIVTIVLAVLKKVPAQEPITACIVCFASFIMFGLLHSQNEKYSKMSDEEFSAQQVDDITRKTVVYLDYDNEAIVCPHCGSHDILLKEKKFSKSKAFIGATIFGLKGAVFGIPSHKRVKCCCADCGHKFEAVRR